MLLSVDIESKTMGNKELFAGLKFSVEAKEKLAIIGRNGVGKTTLFRMLSGEDHDFAGDIQLQRGMRLVSTAQEHHAVAHESVLDYVVGNLPEFARLKNIIDTFPETMGDDMQKITAYSNALERFSELGYYNIEDVVLQSLAAYQIDETKARGALAKLSGGQKRFVELVRIEHANADIVLIDEPTNHMDFVAKAAFIEWLKAAPQTVLVITHDRDVLQSVGRIIEIKDGRANISKGNYENYLKQNAASTATKMNDYEIGLRTLENLQKQIAWARARKPSWHGTADQRNPFVVMERRLQKELDELQARLVKPNFWIDRESAEGLNKKVGDHYAKYKAQNIRITKNGEAEQARELVRVEDLQLGYGDAPLFAPVNFRLQHGDRLRLIGRNGAGKTTLVRALLAAAEGKRAETWRAGSIFCSNKLRLSVYEQETDAGLLALTLAEAIEQTYRELGVRTNNELVMRTMGDYLFNPHEDGRLPVAQLSGGQKARLQIIKMLASNPNLLILDEPTNHLDLPSVEELENALGNYHGALLYVTHDSYFAKNIGGEALTLAPAL